MKLLLDTQLLIWIANTAQEISPAARELLEDQNNSLIFSVASLWEIAIKFSLKRHDFLTDPASLRTVLLGNDCMELVITAAHGIGVSSLPPIHKDPFDRLLVAQAISEGMVLLTTDRKVAAYPGPIRLV